MAEKLYTVDDLVEYLQYSKKTILKLIHSGKLPARKVLSEWRVLESELLAYLKKFDNIKKE
jgi:excisionase family DNA binding protein